MNKSEKIVFSRTLKKVDWHNSRIVNGDIVEEMRKLKAGSGSDMCILGSGSIVTQMAAAGLIDEYMFMVDPVILGEGTPVCKGMDHALNLKLKKTRTFKSGTLLLTYEPISK
jgi:dihydrofolate reductase